MRVHVISGEAEAYRATDIDVETAARANECETSRTPSESRDVR